MHLVLDTCIKDAYIVQNEGVNAIKMPFNIIKIEDSSLNFKGTSISIHLLCFIHHVVVAFP